MVKWGLLNQTNFSLVITFIIQLNEVQHDHILIKIENDCFLQHLSDYIGNSNTKNNSLSQFIHEIKHKAQVSQVTLLIQNFKQFLK